VGLAPSHTTCRSLAPRIHPRIGAAHSWKRPFDLVLGSVALILAMPLLVLASLAIVFDSGFPILFRQTRVGTHGADFLLIKFRTLDHTAEFGSALGLRNEAAYPLFKVRNDPRTTRAGWILRRLNLDELPQLWNVLRGEMSLVGPRPFIRSEIEALPRASSAIRMGCRPGITGAWQVSPNRHAGLDCLLRADLWYADHESALTDIRILTRTLLPSVVRTKAPWELQS
jgi:lipopolysaccharide/colanic/teichoic acid biosynthesis glycosyltransferase